MWHRQITIKLDISNLPKFGIKNNTDFIGLVIFIIVCVIGLYALALHNAKSILKVKIKTKKDKIMSAAKKPNSENEFDINNTYFEISLDLFIATSNASAMISLKFLSSNNLIAASVVPPFDEILCLKFLTSFVTNNILDVLLRR